MVNPAPARPAPSGPQSMTGFATARGTVELADAVWEWSFELRAVNGRGLDLRLRVPDWVEGLEPALRAQLQARLVRGSVSLNLRLSRAAAAGGLQPAAATLAQAMAALAAVEQAAVAAGVALQPSSAAQVLGLRALAEPAGELPDPAPLRTALLAQVPALLDALVAMRGAEGARLARALDGQLDRITALLGEVRALLPARAEAAGDALRAALARLTAASGTEVTVDPGRLAQELALLAVKGDVTEELDRLDAHLAAARTLLAGPGPMGRRLDFLMQEFNREANTLCAKSDDAALTRLGLDLKVVIDQMREQVQNLE